MTAKIINMKKSEENEEKLFSFPEWLASQLQFAEAMSLEENKTILPEMIDSNMTAWGLIAELFESGELVYQAINTD